MSKYTDGFVLPVSKKNIKRYRAMSVKAGKLWREFGAVDYKECVLDNSPTGFGLSFPRGIRAKKGEVVVFSWIVYKSRKHRDLVNKRVMADPRIHSMCKEDDMPFDPKRMIYGGFEVIVDAFE
jgi:uncharacterized protein YbaA (DUF1428 family)